MKKVLSAICVFTIVACLWLFAMFFVLRHPGFGWRAGVTGLLIAQTAATLGVVRGSMRAPWMRAELLAGAAMTILVGVLAFRANEASSDWEGYVALISGALVIQGALTVATMVRMPSGK